MKHPIRKLLVSGVVGLAVLVGATNIADAANANLALAAVGGPVHYSARVAFQTNNNVGLVVADGNRAQASSLLCDGCKAVAVAVQIDLAAGPVVSIHAINKAISTENRSVDTQTCAIANQFVIAPDVKVVFSASGRAGIAAVAAAVNSEAKSADDCATITASVAGSMSTLTGVLADPNSYAPGDPGSHVLPHLNVNRYQDNQAA